MQKSCEGQKLWDFMLAVYDLPDVAPACLRLQEVYGLDVPLFLAVLHAVATGRRMDREALALLERSCAPWRQEVIAPLRRIRRRMKAPDLLSLHQAVPALREAIKDQELQAERIAVELLATLLLAWPVAPVEGVAAERLYEAGEWVLDLTDAKRVIGLPEEVQMIVAAVLTLLSAWQITE